MAAAAAPPPAAASLRGLPNEYWGPSAADVPDVSLEALRLLPATAGARAAVSAAIATAAGSALAILVVPDQELTLLLQGLDDATVRASLHAAVAMADFKGVAGSSTALVPVPVSALPAAAAGGDAAGGDGGSITHVFFVGLGKQAHLAAAAATSATSGGGGANGGGAPWGHLPWHAAGGAIAAAARANRLRAVKVLCLVPHGGTRLDAGAASALAESAVAGMHEGMLRFKSKPEQRPRSHLRTLTLLHMYGSIGGDSDSAAAAADALRAALRRGRALALGQLTARALTEAPACVATPRHLADAARHIAAMAPGLFELRVLDEAQCAGLGLGLFLGVARGSEEPPLLIHLTYRSPAAAAAAAAGAGEDVVALVGKGITFDSGGYNLKTQGGIETMNGDMGGCGAVLGAARVLAELRPPGLEAHFISAACENMVSGRATRPGDVHVSAAGLTVEVNDTDAEGRLTLADALWYAQEVARATTVVDIATLTGAAGVALGDDTAAAFSNDDALFSELDAAAADAGERLWRLPLNAAGLKKRLESQLADLKNYGGRPGGAITAALFLERFVRGGDGDGGGGGGGGRTAWAHLDIAGPAWNSDGLPTGFGAATLASFLLRRAQAEEAVAAAAQ